MKLSINDISKRRNFVYDLSYSKARLYIINNVNSTIWYNIRSRQSRTQNNQIWHTIYDQMLEIKYVT